LGKSKLPAGDEVFTSLPLGKPVTSQGRWGPPAVDEAQTSFPPGEGGPLAVDEGSFINPHPGCADPPPREG